jgi:ABC-type transport system substrate-binding protein
MERRRSLTRRDVLVRAAGVAVSTPTLAAILAACGGSETSAPTVDTPETATASVTATQASEAEPVQGGTLRFAELNDPGVFDTRKWGDNSWMTSLALFNGIVRLSADGKSVEPDLLEEYTVTPAGDEYSLVLRRGVEFHHGRELTADDVKFTLEYVIHPDNAQDAQSLYAGIPFAGKDEFLEGAATEITGIKVVDPYTLSIQLASADSAFLYAMSLPMAFILPRDEVERLGDDFATQPSGTGPFTFASYEPGKMLVLERNERYFREGVPYLDRVEIEYGIEPDLMLLRIQNDELDLTYDTIPAGQLKPLEDNPDTSDQVVIGSYADCWYCAMDLDHPALSVLQVRQAIAHAIDKDRVIRVLGGLGVRGDGGIFGPETPYFQEDFPTYAYDPERSRALLDEAGFADGFDVRLLAVNETPDQDTAEVVQEDLRQVGIRADLVTMARAPAFDEKVKNGGMIIERWELPYPHGSYVIDAGFTSGAIEGGCCNWSHVSDGEIDRLAAEGHTATDPAEIGEIYKELDRRLTSEMVLWVPIFYPQIAQLKSERVRGFDVPAAPTGQTKFFDRYWLVPA